MAAGEAARADFARHWQAQFPGEPAPRMELGSVRAMERELERCRRHLRRLQRALAEERFKVGYLEAALARAPPPAPPLAAPRPAGSSPEGGSAGSSDAEDASSAGG
ncbi:breakpoint cluster region protein-like protein [Turdus rufiventris]|nr:breakpoint cluster region protein-like protein [Turdus rufiventris]